VLEAEEPLHRSVHDADNRRKRRGRIDPEMRVDDSAELIWTHKGRNELSGDYGRHGQDDAVIVADAYSFLAEVESYHPVLAEVESAQAMPEHDRHVAGTQEPQGGLHEGISQTVCAQ
jgi:hypothetical protein